MTCRTNCTVNFVCHNCTTNQLGPKIENITNEPVPSPSMSTPTSGQLEAEILKLLPSLKKSYPDKTVEITKNNLNVEPKQTIEDTMPTKSKVNQINTPNPEETSTVPVDPTDSTTTIGPELPKTDEPSQGTTDKGMK